jgi:hypothetical protein
MENRMNCLNLMRIMVAAAILLICGVGIASAQTDAQFLANLKATEKKNVPVTVGNFQIFDVVTLCPSGCDFVHAEKLLLFKAFTPNLSSGQLTPQIIRSFFIPMLFTNYCGSEQARRGIGNAATVWDNQQRTGPENDVYVRASDCPATAAPKPKAALVNLALRKTATQSSNIGPGYPAMAGLAAKAVDGKTDGNWGAGSVTATADKGSANPWWQVDLGADYNVNKIQIWNRTDCCRERLNNFRIWTRSASGKWEEFAPGLKTYKLGEKYPLSFTESKRARYVMVQIPSPNAILSLAEVEVLGTK